MENKFYITDSIYYKDKVSSYSIYNKERLYLQEKFKEKVWVEWDKSKTRFVITRFGNYGVVNYKMFFMNSDILNSQVDDVKTEEDHNYNVKCLDNLAEEIKTTIYGNK